MITYVLPFFLALGSCCAYLTTVNKTKRFGKTFFRLQDMEIPFLQCFFVGQGGGSFDSADDTTSQHTFSIPAHFSKDGQ